MLTYRRGTIPEVSEFEELFPKFHHELSTESPQAEEQGLWELSAGIYKRYVLTMEIKIEFAHLDLETKEVISAGSHEEPTFTLWEVNSVSIPVTFFTPRYASATRTLIKSFEVDTWQKLVKTKGDFSVLGIELKKDNPVLNFELAYYNNY